MERENSSENRPRPATASDGVDQASGDDLSARFLTAIRRHQNASDMVDEAVAELLGINLTDARCLDIIDQNGPMTPSALAAESGLSAAAVTTVVDRLEKSGYALRKPDAVDRRRVQVEVTDETRRMSALIYGHMSALGQKKMGALSADQVRLIIHFLETSTSMSRVLAQTISRCAPNGKPTPKKRREAAQAIDAALRELVAGEGGSGSPG